MGLIDTDLSFDPRDPYFPAPGATGVEWALQVFTTTNGYGLDSAGVRLSDDRTHLHADRYAWLGQQLPVDAGSVDVAVTSSGGVLEWSIAVRHEEPIKSVKLLLRGLPAEQLRAGWWAPNTGRGRAHGVNGQRFQLEYPGPDWATPWVAAGTEQSGLVLSVRDPLVRRQILHVHQPPYAPGPITELVHLPMASARSTSYQVPPIRLRPGTDAPTADADLDEHMSFVEQAHGLQPWATRPDVPDWMRRIALVVTLHGQHWTGYVFNTFPQMAEALRFVAQHIEPHRVLAYLPGWEGRYYYAYPQYHPGEDMGGAEGFAALTRSARQLGVRLMPMFGGHGANVVQYPPWERAVLRNDTDRYVELLNRPDWDSDRVGEGDQVFLNPGEPEFRAHLVESISATVRNFGVDAAFLDTLGFWFNDPRHDVFDGYRQLVAELRSRHPELVLAVEGWWDALMSLFPLSQQWYGMDRDLRKPRVLNRYARTTGHLAEGTPGQGSTGVHEKGFLPRPPDVFHEGHIPVVGISDTTLPAQADEVAAICRWAAEHGPA
ncbi:hypothetical protein F1721_06505 [Saccharopolyspora hirsuta]|uniref:Uncharacterized protein n=1 Tax=Saccharopolyspora hirsuta TaxID=1837 RepID=A0A5M7C0M3_SACHI|nr:hypothetical protein [Saccharopolyspora hirsuta]KAA5835996.1 hypothetical protein F1721_06505 [Saccharopolyspora hirsuta]